MLTFDTAYDRLIGNEGGYSNNPDDPGGETNWGITLPVLHRAIGAGLVPNDTTVKNLSREQAKAIYHQFFWESAHAGELPGGVAFQLFDWVVNSGIETAVRGLQRALGVVDDGVVGAVTLGAAKAMSESDLIMRLNAERLDFLRQLTAWKSFGRGWAGRIATNLRYGAEDS